MLEVVVNIDGAQKRLSKISREVGNTAKVNRQLGISLYGVVMRNFRDQSSNGEDWAALKAGGRWKGRGKKRELDTSAKALLDTGALRQSFLPFSDAAQAGVGAKSYVPRKGGDAPADLAAIHEFGTKYIPARPMLPTLSQGLALALNVYGAAIKRGTKGAV